MQSSLASRLVTGAAVVLLVAGLAGCGDDDNGDPSEINAAKVCPGGEMQNLVVQCRSLFSDGERLRLPEDPADGRRYGAITRGGAAFFTRSGELPLGPDVVKELGSIVDAGGGGAYANTVYLATIVDGVVTVLSPVVWVREDAFVPAFFAGVTLEGTIATWDDSSGGYDWSRTLPIRIEIGDSMVEGVLSGAITGQIVNADEAVMGADGSCLAALSDDVERNPLRDSFTSEVSLERYPSMHALFDDEMLLVWGASLSNMGAAFYPSVATLLGADPLDAEWQTVIHGTPTAGPAVTLHLVDGGGGPCDT